MPYRAFAIVALLLNAACSHGPAHVAEVTLFGVRLCVSLTPAHLYLAEYSRQLEVTRGRQAQKKELFGDSGGYAWVVVRTRAGQLEVVDLGGVEYTVPVSEASASPQYLGRFDFDARRRYSFIPASVDATDPSAAFDAPKP